MVICNVVKVHLIMGITKDIGAGNFLIVIYSKPLTGLHRRGIQYMEPASGVEVGVVTCHIIKSSTEHGSRAGPSTGFY